MTTHAPRRAEIPLRSCGVAPTAETQVQRNIGMIKKEREDSGIL